MEDVRLVCSSFVEVVAAVMLACASGRHGSGLIVFWLFGRVEKDEQFPQGNPQTAIRGLLGSWSTWSTSMASIETVHSRGECESVVRSVSKQSRACHAEPTLLSVSLPQECSAAEQVFYTWSRSGSSSFTASALNKPSSSSSFTASASINLSPPPPPLRP